MLHIQSLYIEKGSTRRWIEERRKIKAYQEQRLRGKAQRLVVCICFGLEKAGPRDKMLVWLAVNFK